MSLIVDDEDRALLLLEFSLGPLCANAVLLGFALDAAGVAAEAKAPPCDTRGKDDVLPMMLAEVLDASTCWAVVVALAEPGKQDEEEPPASKGGAAAP